MKKLSLVSFLLMVFSVSLLRAAPQAQETAVVPDSQLEKEIRQQITLAPHYGVFDNLAFKLDGNDVTLLGQALLPITRDEVQKRVAKVAGIGKIANKIEVLPLSSRDDLVRLRVYRSIFNSSGLYRYALSPNPSIHIIVNGARVTLEGIVGNEQDSKIAFVAANKVPAVLSVTNNLKIEK